MKLRTLLLSTLVFSLWSCNQSESSSTTNNDSIVGEKHVHTNKPELLNLNNGEKWQADESTRMHANRLIAEIELFHKTTEADLPAYQKLSATIAKELNLLIKGCKMTGPDHDALHRWLEQVIETNNFLANAKTLDEARALSTQLTENVVKFNQFFN